METEVVLKMLVEMGVINAGQIDDLRGKLNALKNTTDDTGDVTKKLTDSMDESGESSKKLEINHRALHAIMNMIGQQTAPQLGHALTGALYGPIGIALAIGYAFEFVRKRIAETNKELDDFAALAADRGETIKQAMDKAFVEVLTDEAAAALKKRFDDMATGMERYNTAAQQAVTLAKELRQIELEKTNAQDAAANAADDNRVKEGTMTKEQAELNRLNRATAEERAKVAKEEADRAGELAAKRAEEAKAQTDLLALLQQQAALPKPDLIGDANKEIAGMPKSAQKEFADAAATAPSGAGDLTTEIGRKATEAFLTAQNEVAKKMIGESGKDGKPGTGYTGERDKAQEELEAAQERNAKAQKDLETLTKHEKEPGWQINPEGHELIHGDASFYAAQLKAAQDKVDSDNKAISNSNDVILQNELRIASIKATLDAEKAYTEKIDALTKKIGDLDLQITGMAAVAAAHTGSGGDPAIQAAKDAEEFEKGKKIVESFKPSYAGKDDLDIGGELNVMVTKHLLNQQQVLDIVKSLISHAGKTGDEWNFLNGKIADLQTQVAGNH